LTFTCSKLGYYGLHINLDSYYLTINFSNVDSPYYLGERVPFLRFAYL
jgi:hypothetical protein